MRVDSLRSLSVLAEIRVNKIRNRRSGFTSVVGTVILITAVTVLGSFMVIWANTTVNAHQQTMGDSYEKNSNILKETLMIEDVWLSTNPANSVNVEIRNIGDIAVDIKEVKILALDSSGGLACTSLTCQSGTSATKTVTAPFNPGNSDGVIASKQTIRIDVSNIDWDHANSASLDISVTTERGSIERMIWEVP